MANQPTNAPAALLSESVNKIEQRRIAAWDETMGDAFTERPKWSDIDVLLAYIKELQGQLARYQADTAESAREINCAGPISHRIRILKKEHAEQVQQLQEQLQGAVEEIRAAQRAEDFN